MDTPSPNPHALRVLHQTTPALIALCFCAALILDVAFRLPSKPKPAQRQWRKASIYLSWLTIFTYATEVVLFVTHSLVQRGWWAAHDSVIFVVASVLLWGIMTLVLVDSDSPRWAPYAASWLLGLTLEIAMCALSAPVYTEQSRFADVHWIVMILRLLCLTLLAFVGLTILTLPRTSEEAPDEERQSLLASPTTESQSTTAYGSISEDDTKATDSESEDEEKEIKERQRQRLLDAGGWWAYLKSFFILFPIIWPARNRKMQFYIFVMILCTLAERAFNILIPRQVGIISDELAKDWNTGKMPLKAIFIWIGLQLLNSRVGIDSIFSMLSTVVEQFSSAQLTKAAFKHVMGLSMNFHTEKNSGELLKAVEQGHSITAILEYVFFETLPLIMDLVAAFIYLSNLFDEYLALTVVALAVTYLYSTIRLTAYNRERRRVFIDKYMKENSIMYESVSNWQTVAYFNRGSYEQTRLNAAVQDHNDSFVRYSFTYNLIFATQALITSSGLLSASLIAAYRISQGTASVGSFVTLIQYWGTLSYPLSNLAHSYSRLSSDLIDAERMLQLFLTKTSIADKPNAPELVVKGGHVEYDGVSFAYDPRKPTLDDVSFEAKPGQTIALVGETGSGKSTVLKLLLRFYDVTKGSIKVDGQDLRDVTLDSLREVIGVVPQDPSMFNTSIMENIRYARLEATDEEVYAACRAAAVHEKIVSFPDGYKSKVGERGVKLSGGELQRVAIARVLLKNPQLVLLDEATSAVDSATEIQIQEAFRKLSRGRTTFVVAHRLSTIMDADLILVLENGRIIERGTQEELLQQGGKYVDLWTKQTSRRTESTAKNSINSSDYLIDDVHPGLSGTESLLEQLDGQNDDDSDAKCCGNLRAKLSKKFNPDSVGPNDKENDDVDSEVPTALQMISPTPTYSKAEGKASRESSTERPSKHGTKDTSGLTSENGSRTEVESPSMSVDEDERGESMSKR
ncbi:putative ABC transporter [Macrophomina phaseolina]|uniref:ABC transporter n=1 Tax=Macrophomina phaseolina TaxID=35725 RepID=A0ABQ8G6A4_9PEZI|nr:putative ABC transporter [Macrophomina phaseolina]